MNPIYLTLQKNTIQTQRGNQIIAKFDLKGSRYKRKVIDSKQLKALNKATEKEKLQFIRSTLANDTIDPKDLEMMKKIQKNEILKGINKSTLKDVDLEFLRLKQFIDINISEQDTSCIIKMLD